VVGAEHVGEHALRTERIPVSGVESGWDHRLFEEVVSVLRRAEPAPPEVLAAARDAYAWRRTVVAIAGLEFDSVIDDDDDLARVRDAGSERRLRFRGPSGTVEVTVIDGGRRLVGRFEPPVQGSVMLRHAGGSTATTAVDELGWFFFEALPQGAISLRPVPADPAASVFETEWVTV
jgi:hypothetical protein